MPAKLMGDLLLVLIGIGIDWGIKTTIPPRQVFLPCPFTQAQRRGSVFFDLPSKYNAMLRTIECMLSRAVL